MSTSSPAVAIITGASRGIGRATAMEMTRHGYKVALVGRSLEGLEDVHRQAGNNAKMCLVVPSDLNESDVSESVIGTVIDEWGKVDILINAAGIGTFGPITELTDTQWDNSIDLNLSAPFRLIRAVLPSMLSRGSGHIINVSSLAGRRAFAYGSAYCASKSGLIGFTEALRAEVRLRGIRVSLITPGLVNSGFLKELTEPDDPLHLAIPESEIARAILYVAEQHPFVETSDICLRPTRPNAIELFGDILSRRFGKTKQR